MNQDRLQRGYNSFVPLEPLNQLQVDLADMKAFGGKPYPFMLVAIDALTKKVAAEPLKDRLASTTAAGMKKVFQALGVPANVYSDDGSEFKREFKELMDFWDIEKQVTRGHAYFAERIIRTIKEAMLRRIAAGAGRRGQWHLMLADVLSHGRKHATPHEDEDLHPSGVVELEGRFSATRSSLEASSSSLRAFSSRSKAEGCALGSQQDRQPLGDLLADELLLHLEELPLDLSQRCDIACANAPRPPLMPRR